MPISIEEGGRRRLNAVCELCEFASVVVRDWTHKEALLEMLDASKRRWMEDRVVVADEAVVSSDERRRVPLISSLVERKETFVSHVFFTSGSTGAPKGCVASGGAVFILHGRKR